MCIIYLLCQQLCKELLHCPNNKKRPSSSFQSMLCATLRGWVTLGRGFSPSFPDLFPITRGGRTALTTATNVQHSASPNLPPVCSREGSGNELSEGETMEELWKRAGA